MRYEARLSAYDCMASVQVSVKVWNDEGDVLETTTSFAGVGESDTRQWLEDVLVAALETL